MLDFAVWHPTRGVMNTGQFQFPIALRSVGGAGEGPSLVSVCTGLGVCPAIFPDSVPGPSRWRPKALVPQSAQG